VGGIGVAAALGVVITLIIGLHQYFGQIQANVETTHSLASGITASADQAKTDAAHAISEGQGTREELRATKAQVEAMQAQLRALAAEVERLRQQPPPPTPPGRR
jgi:negative regulator of sigma E activity